MFSPLLQAFVDVGELRFGGGERLRDGRVEVRSRTFVDERHACSWEKGPLYGRWAGAS